MSSPLNYGTPSSLSTPRSNLRGAMTPARQRADLKSNQHGRSVPAPSAPTPTKRVSFMQHNHKPMFVHCVFSLFYIVIANFTD